MEDLVNSIVELCSSIANIVTGCQIWLLFDQNGLFLSFTFLPPLQLVRLVVKSCDIIVKCDQSCY